MRIRSLTMAGASAALLLASVGVTGAATAAPTGGANESGPYTATCDWSESECDPSMNGKGGGKAVGQPGAGEVGKADLKNPPGQVKKHGGDPDYGYECEELRNFGVGKGNPAHSGCEYATPQ